MDFFFVKQKTAYGMRISDWSSDVCSSDLMTVAANYGGNDEKARAFTEEHGIPAYKWDVSDHEACQRGVARVVDDLGPVDVLVNNAGLTRDGIMLKMTYEMWKEVIDVNLGGRSEERR